MARHEINRFTEMEVFVTVIETGGFSAAGRHVRLTPSAISKLIARLEARLGTRLFNRSTRQFQLTPEGCTFYEAAKRILADLSEAEQRASQGERPAGRVRISTSASYFHHVLAHIVPQFMALYPAVTLDISLTDALVDLLAERTDIAIRTGPLKTSSLIARKLGETARTIVAAPSYLEQYGQPRHVADLKSHNLLGFSYVRSEPGWTLSEDNHPVVVPVAGRVQISDGEGVRRLAVAGAGLAMLADFTVRDDVTAGRLAPVLSHCNTGDTEVFYAVYIGEGGPLPARIRVVLDFLSEHGRVR
ncbi:LysR family transcriptional regulator [Rhizobium rhizogenes]|uniref:HTH-type transcriptional regulator TtuA n=1 Tax=Rhizobium rhizogenes TaxID=359 RepID=A0AA92C611_RHIRH|nr:LysR family transcriptional regulator [Rhizobium rhizogenes]PVE56535.1 LysR family transcriptional regulator [Rhizobium rhizogenes]PVE65030.1 LysR family transcriptional regulator [Agrobacterium tumefaciens]PVE74168.1 LysR family transcriptional regulator [Sphingomonas sp. TPD3009]